ncbi:hypothetical protein L3X37_08560 [Sabulilitoribacter arenilitoris]|uniref:Uncharacterized protein n=1 Tax=Wocania arenilitoris TaxID=2044858 RepID=A0AAE3EN25_9FLAO|nr:hypothetical protein [Wocania arenilitoris]MCF7568415.1 hypothetical protein [Wocania arenilitoris]
MHYLLNTKPIYSLKSQELNLASGLTEFVKASRELNTFEYSLLRSNQTDKALFVFNLNTKIFPYKHNVYDSLGEAYFETKNYTETLKSYYKVLSLKPDGRNAVSMVNKINQVIK